MSRYSGAAVLGLLVATSCQKENSTRSEISPASIAKRADQVNVEPIRDSSVVPTAAPSCAPATNQGMFTAVGESGNNTLALIRSRQTAAGQTFAIAADEDEQSLHIVDVATKTSLGLSKLAGKPARVLVMDDGRIVVSLSDISALEVLEPTPETIVPLKRLCLVETAAEPLGLAMTPDRKTLLVTTRWEPTLSAFSALDLSLEASVALPRDPTSVMTSSDGQRAFITHAAGGIMSIVDVEKVNDKPQFKAPIPLPLSTDHIEVRPKTRHLKKFAVKEPPPFDRHHTRLGSQGFVLARHEKKILSPLVMVEPKPASGSSSGYGSSSVKSPAAVGQVATIHESNGQIGLAPSLQNFGPKDCLLPRAAVVDPVKNELLVSCLGHNSVVMYDATPTNPHDYEKRRFTVPSGPTGLAIDVERRQVIVYSSFAGKMSFLSLDPLLPPSTKITKQSTRRVSRSKPKHGDELVTIELPGRQGLPAEIALGRELFHAAGRTTVSSDGRVCASCHPDGRDDGFTWQTQEGPRQTPILLGRLNQDTAPFGWLGDKETLPSHFQRTVERLKGSGVKDAERDAIFAYVGSLRAPQSHKPSMNAMIARGQKIFESTEAGCSSCHLGESTTDGSKHDVKSAKDFEVKLPFETPSLRFIARSAPYYHNGQYATLLDVINGCDGEMGKTKHLAAEDKASLVAYLETM